MVIEPWLDKAGITLISVAATDRYAPFVRNRYKGGSHFITPQVLLKIRVSRCFMLFCVRRKLSAAIGLLSFDGHVPPPCPLARPS